LSKKQNGVARRYNKNTASDKNIKIQNITKILPKRKLVIYIM